VSEGFLGGVAEVGELPSGIVMVIRAVKGQDEVLSGGLVTSR
jgi:hypothetical protein